MLREGAHERKLTVNVREQAGKFIVGWYKLRKNPQDKRAQRQFYLTRKKYNQIKSMAQVRYDCPSRCDASSIAAEC